MNRGGHHLYRIGCLSPDDPDQRTRQHMYSDTFILRVVWKSDHDLYEHATKAIGRFKIGYEALDEDKKYHFELINIDKLKLVKLWFGEFSVLTYTLHGWCRIATVKDNGNYRTTGMDQIEFYQTKRVRHTFWQFDFWVRQFILCDGTKYLKCMGCGVPQHMNQLNKKNCCDMLTEANSVDGGDPPFAFFLVGEDDEELCMVNCNRSFKKRSQAAAHTYICHVFTCPTLAEWFSVKAKVLDAIL